MNLERVYNMTFASVYPLYIAKVERKGQPKEGVDQIIFWLTGYNQNDLNKILSNETNFKDFFDQAPKLNPNRELTKGVICGVRVEDIEDFTMKHVRYLDKLIDELAKGKSLEKIFRH